VPEEVISILYHDHDAGSACAADTTNKAASAVACTATSATAPVAAACTASATVRRRAGTTATAAGSSATKRGKTNWLRNLSCARCSGSANRSTYRLRKTSADKSVSACRAYLWRYNIKTTATAAWRWAKI
jgi:hypothetical protein